MTCWRTSLGPLSVGLLVAVVLLVGGFFEPQVWAQQPDTDDSGATQEESGTEADEQVGSEGSVPASAAGGSEEGSESVPSEDSTPGDSAGKPDSGPAMDKDNSAQPASSATQPASSSAASDKRVGAEEKSSLSDGATDLPKCERLGESAEKGGKKEDASTKEGQREGGQIQTEFSAAVQRYAVAAMDYQNEVHGMLKQAMGEQKHYMEKSYEKDLVDLDLSEREARNAAIKRFRAFVKRYPNHPQYTPDALFRLAELYFEKSEIVNIDATEEYEKERDLYERGKIPTEPRMPERDHSETVRVYKTLISRFVEKEGIEPYRYADAVYYLLGYVLEESMEDEKAEKAWVKLVTMFPKSNYAPEVLLRLGEMKFDFAEYPAAVRYYKKVLNFKDSRFYDKSLYKLGWAYFQDYDYDRAIRVFKELIGWYETNTKSAGGATATALRDEAIDYLALSLTEDDWDNDGLLDADAGVKRALGYLSEGLSFERKIIVGYAKGLFELADKKKWGEAIEVYNHLIKMDPLSVDAPQFHTKILQIYDELGEVDKAAAERQRMTELFGHDTAWWKANSKARKVTDRMERALEEAMRRRALFHHERAQILKDEAMTNDDSEILSQSTDQYIKAAKAYEDYLKAYPNEKAIYELTFYWADALWYSAQFEKAAPIYEQVARHPTETMFKEPAAWYAIQARQKMLETGVKQGSFTSKMVPGSDWEPGEALAPEQAEGEGEGEAKEEEGPATDVTRITGEPLPEVLKPWLIDVDFFTENDVKLGGSRTQQGEVAYMAADMYLRFRNYPEARKRFASIISCYPTEDIAASAAANIINTYQEENDWTNVELWADLTERLNLGDEEQQAEIRAAIKKVKLFARISSADKLYREKQYLEAATEFEQIADQNPDLKFSDRLYFNAADAYASIKYYDSAARLFEILVTDPKYSESAFAEDSLMRLAETNKQFFNFEKATMAFQALFDRYPASKNRKYVFYQTAVMEESAGNFREAAMIFEKYAKTYTDDAKTSAGSLLRAANIYESIGDKKQYRRLLRYFIKTHYQTEEMDEIIVDSMSTLRKIARDRGDKKSAKKYSETITKEYRDRKLPPGGLAAKAAAQSRFEEIEIEYKAYKRNRVKTTNQKKANKQVTDKRDKLNELTQTYNSLAEYKSFDWLIAAAYRVAGLYAEFAEFIYAMPEPSGLDEEEYDVYITMVEDLGIKYENVAIQAYQTAFEQARRFKVQNEWAQKALVAINKFKPAEYPLFKEEKMRTVFQPLYTIETRVPEGRK